jgi:hypothetical protein
MEPSMAVQLSCENLEAKIQFVSFIMESKRFQRRPPPPGKQDIAIAKPCCL